MRKGSDDSSVDLVGGAARNDAGWFDWQLRAHGLDCRYADSLWSCWEPGPEFIPEAITLTPAAASTEQRSDLEAEIEQLLAARPRGILRVLDWWSTLDLGPLGLEPVATAERLIRRPGATSPAITPPELEIERVRTPEALVEFEQATFAGFEFTEDVERGDLHAAASVHDPRGRYFVGRVEGRPVSVSIAVASDAVVGVFGVATLPEFRRRGYGKAMTWAALDSAPTLPAVIGPSPMSDSLYRRMGFNDFHTFRIWARQGQDAAT